LSAKLQQWRKGMFSLLFNCTSHLIMVG